MAGCGASLHRCTPLFLVQLDVALVLSLLAQSTSSCPDKSATLSACPSPMLPREDREGPGMAFAQARSQPRGRAWGISCSFTSAHGRAVYLPLPLSPLPCTCIHHSWEG